MRFVAFLILAPAIALASDRLCPDGYSYVLDDVTNQTLVSPDPRNVDEMARGGTYYVEEVGRSPYYSCYKLVLDEPADWVSATSYCGKEDAQLASFESLEEMIRVRNFFQDDFQPKVAAAEESRALPRGLDVLTSGMFFEEVQNWFWVGSNRSLSNAAVHHTDDIPDNKPTKSVNFKPCLNIRMTNPTQDPILIDSDCFKGQPFICEARVQTVTYYTWFRANWVDFMLGFLLVIMFVALCVAVCSFSSRDYGTRTRRTRATVHTVSPMEQHNAYAHDYPPAYDQTVGVKPPAEPQPSRYQTFKTKTTKVFYMPGFSRSSNNNTNTQ